LAAAQDPGVVADVPYLASPQLVVDEMLRIAQVGPGDVVYDLGAGDGRVVITAAAKFGARGVGVEIDAKMVTLSRANVARAGLAQRVRILHQDVFDTDLTEATVITLYLAPHLNLRLRERLLGLKPGTRIVSHSSDLGDWKPDLRRSIRKDVLLWHVPARVEGAWRSRLGESLLELEFRQRFQALSAEARLDGQSASVWEARLRGAQLEFVLVDPRGETSLHLTGRVVGDAILGEVARDVGAARKTTIWRAARSTSGVK
jgi:hypothetical protein